MELNDVIEQFLSDTTYSCFEQSSQVFWSGGYTRISQVDLISGVSAPVCSAICEATMEFIKEYIV